MPAFVSSPFQISHILCIMSRTTLYKMSMFLVADNPTAVTLQFIRLVSNSKPDAFPDSATVVYCDDRNEEHPDKSLNTLL